MKNATTRLRIHSLSHITIMNPNSRFLSACVAALVTTLSAQAQFSFQKDDKICLIGNSLAERMQHDCWVETLLQRELPKQNLTFRNLAASGDQVSRRPRSEHVPDSVSLLTLCKADVIFSFFGYNESFDGPGGIEKFKQDYAKMIDEYKAKNFNGKQSLKFVIFSPIAVENTKSRFVPDGTKSNAILEQYTAALKEVAEQKKETFVDLFTASKELYAKAKEPLTLNGVHLSNEGNRQLAMVIAKALLAKNVASSPSDKKLREAVMMKDIYWHNRYRASDSNDVWGNRSGLRFVNGQSNGDVLQHEIAMWDVLTVNRDKRVWALAQGSDLKIDDSNVPAALPVMSNIGDKNNNKVDYVDGKEAVALMKTAPGFKVNLFADEKMFPELIKPVQMSVDTKGRLWAAAWQTYPKWEPGKSMEDRLLIFPDNNRDGVADKCITFAKVHNPTGFVFWNGGVLVASCPDIIFLKDTDGDDVADVRQVYLQGLDSADTHHAVNNMFLGPDGAVYYQRGVFIVENVETPWSKAYETSSSGMYRFDPRKFIFSFHAENGPNPHGVSFDAWGYHYATDGTSGNAFQVVPQQNGFKMRVLLNTFVRPVPSSGIMYRTQVPPENQQNFMICNSIGFLGIKQYKLNRNPQNGEVNGTEVPDLMVSSDKNFRPTDVEIGDDGALYFSDWQNIIIGHMQHNVRDPKRDHEHGRIYRMIAEGRPLETHVKIDGEKIPTLLNNLKHPTDQVRYRTRIELSEHKPDEVIAACKTWMKQFDPKKVEDAHHLLEALWIHQQFDVKDFALLETVLNSPEPHARVAAKTVQHYWSGKGIDKKAIVEDVSPFAKSPAPKVREDGTLEVTIATVVEAMKYEIPEFSAKAGQKVELVFNNPDNMPHNIVITSPGAADEIMNAALALGADGFKKDFIPDSPKVLAHTKMLDKNKTETIKFTLPAEPGDYQFICTFPGHGTLMRGVIKVSK